MALIGPGLQRRGQGGRVGREDLQRSEAGGACWMCAGQKKTSDCDPLRACTDRGRKPTKVSPLAQVCLLRSPDSNTIGVSGTMSLYLRSLAPITLGVLSAVTQWAWRRRSPWFQQCIMCWNE